MTAARARCPRTVASRCVPCQHLLSCQWGPHACMQAFCGVSFRFLAGLVAYALPGRPLTVLDAGANIGLASMLFAHYIRFDGTIVAVDASPPTFDVMRANLRDLGPIVKPVLSAIMPTAEAGPGKTVKFGGRAGEFWGGVVLEAGQEKQEVVHEVPTTSLPHLAVRPRTL